MLHAIEAALLAIGWMTIGFFVGLPAILFFAIWVHGLDKHRMRRLAVGVLFAVLLALSALVATERKLRAQYIDCAYFWWTVECWWWSPLITMPEPLRVPTPEAWMWERPR
jgi:hypothetical protein